MKRLIAITALVLFGFNANAITTPKERPLDDYIAMEIERIELETELFGQYATDEKIISIDEIDVYDMEEELELGFNTADHLPEGFDPRWGMHDLDWSSIELYEVEEELDLGFDTKDYLPENFNPYRGMICPTEEVISAIELFPRTRLK